MVEFQPRLYNLGFLHATEDIRQEGLEYAQRAAANLHGGWYSKAYNACVSAYVEGMKP
jgi:hypothetical protein